MPPEQKPNQKNGQKHIVVVDPAIFTAEIENYNFFSRQCPLPSTYHLPALQNLKTLDYESPATTAGIVLFGSGASVNEDRPWQRPLEKWIHEYMNQGIPVLAICYGHQMLAHMLGGKVEFAYPDKAKHTGFREIEIHEPSIFSQSQGKLLVSHNEIVTKVPDCMTVIARSETVPVDAMKHKDLPVWSFQAHPEATNAFRTNRDMPAVAESEYSFGRKIIGDFIQYCLKHL